MEIADIFLDALKAMGAKHRPVFPSYIALRIKEALRDKLAKPDRDFPGADVGYIETVGDCRYAIHITDRNGTRYRVVVEVMADAALQSETNDAQVDA